MLETECLKPGYSPKLLELGLTLLKFVSSHRGLTYVVASKHHVVVILDIYLFFFFFVQFGLLYTITANTLAMTFQPCQF